MDIMEDNRYRVTEAARLAGMTPGRLKQLIYAGTVIASKVSTPLTRTGFYYEITQSEIDRLKTNRSNRGRPRIGDAKDQ